MQAELKRVNAELKKLELARKKELKEHENYRDSVMKRFAYRVGGKTDKFAAKAAKEEKEYFDVLQKLQQQTDQKNTIESMIADGNQIKSGLENQTQAHKQAQLDLDSLYQGIFQGTTPDFPEEDSLEKSAEAASQAHHQASLEAKNCEQVFNMLNDAWNALRQAAAYIEEALSHSRMDMFGGGTMSDMMERNALSKAQNSIHRAEMLTTQAQRLSPHVKDLPSVGIDHGNIMSDVFFDNIFTDMAFHDKIKNSRTQLQRAVAACEQQIDAARERSTAAQHEMQQRWDALLTARNQLQKAREQIFERVLGGQQGQASAPAPPGPSHAAGTDNKGSNNPFDQPPAYSS
ncbi:uncharacterized protein B0I36DRAFT_346657 [Microdochium trichocladiopsis]|uniref:Uncharacterized protein n=1 Tax=Microdochium trichocladiopsis TaxID=1682393 RepID=A0A9P8YDB4_9PEZI|nr:uncharacterized protein B0I36DRAFT_346657 [Microdochium trichocladiopsis]KAH7034767.1 hypothetical protein B0I36DRAFT_346657 [Microdochium trichocladiopsis]